MDELADVKILSTNKKGKVKLRGNQKRKETRQF